VASHWKAHVAPEAVPTHVPEVSFAIPGLVEHEDSTQLAVFVQLSRTQVSVPVGVYPVLHVKAHDVPEATFNVQPFREAKLPKVGFDLHDPSTHDPPLHEPKEHVAVPDGSYPLAQSYVPDLEPDV